LPGALLADDAEAVGSRRARPRRAVLETSRAAPAAGSSGRAGHGHRARRRTLHRSPGPRRLGGRFTVTRLPPALAPWIAELASLTPEMSAIVGGWLGRLEQGLGTLFRRGLAASGEPTGYDGLSRRGVYERLLVSEWLLADEAPDEFVRRAVANEHLFVH